MTREQDALVVSSVAVSCLNKEECGVKLSGKTALVTGAGSRMGRAIAKLFAEEGARVVAVDMNGDSVEAVASEIKASGREAVGVAGNVTKQEDILVNNAGIMDKQEAGGVIINNASVGGLFGTRGGASYVASKHALIGLTKNIAATYGTFNKIRANAIAPGGLNTTPRRAS